MQSSDNTFAMNTAIPSSRLMASDTTPLKSTTTEGLPVDRTVPLTPSNLDQAPPYTFHPSNSFGARAAQTVDVMGKRIGESLQYGAEKLGMKKPTDTVDKVEMEQGLRPAGMPGYVAPTINSDAYGTTGVGYGTMEMTPAEKVRHAEETVYGGMVDTKKMGM